MNSSPPLVRWLQPLRSRLVSHGVAPRVLIWVLVVALSLLSAYVHLWRVSVFRGEAAFAQDIAQRLAAQPKPAHTAPRWR